MAKHTWEGRSLLKGLPCQLTVEHSVSVSVHFMNEFVHPYKNIVIKPRSSNVYNFHPEFHLKFSGEWKKLAK